MLGSLAMLLAMARPWAWCLRPHDGKGTVVWNLRPPLRLLYLLIMLGGLLVGLPGFLALMLEGVAGLLIRREFELGRLLTGCTRRDKCLRLVHGQRHTFVLG